MVPRSSSAPNGPHAAGPYDERSHREHADEHHPAGLREDPAIEPRAAGGPRRETRVAREHGAQRAQQDQDGVRAGHERDRDDEREIGEPVPHLVVELAAGMHPAGPPGERAVEEVQDEPEGREDRDEQEQRRYRRRGEDAGAGDDADRDGRERDRVGRDAASFEAADDRVEAADDARLRPVEVHSIPSGWEDASSGEAASPIVDYGSAAYASAMTPMETRKPARRWSGGRSVSWPIGASPGNQRFHSSLNWSNSDASRSAQFAQTTLSSEVPAPSSCAFRFSRQRRVWSLIAPSDDAAGLGVDRADR